MIQSNINMLPQHIAIIMDGNGRWAREKNLPKIIGYQRGIESAQKIIEYSKDLGIKYLTLYAFSLENWQRPKNQVAKLMNMFRDYLKNDIEKLIKKDIRIIFIGDRLKLDEDIRDSMKQVEDKSLQNSFCVIIAMSYGARNEITSAILKLGEQYGNESLNQNNIEELFESAINPHGIPNPDLLIRTSGEKRLSNFLLWQIAYTELYFTNKYWPDFAKQDLLDAIEDFNKRERKYGK
ncbi:polyprenyl diphosphate synthase [Candidatus Bandiella numerosa]|uniref:polyprenyl diphosphate synthase n=1 Tax=Candidatus Bandiella numerosa TaxID=2570586 RepID=UPI00249D916A|nr:polyprenyl diphosphate synthase [Candidatus Bandiella numerosa]WHA05569.1 polyprenyl diphosphate synthase [Candidatus Bandiella numerosa]